MNKLQDFQENIYRYNLQIIMQINNLIKARLSTGIYTFYKQFPFAPSARYSLFVLMCRKTHITHPHLSQLISIYNQTKAGDRINKKFISTSFRRTMIYLKMDAHIWISCTGWSASPMLTSFPVSRL